MKQHWFLIALVGLSFLLAGCPPAPEQAGETAAPSSLAVDPTALPAPRPALAASPDLSGGVLVVNDATLAKMTADGVPASVTDALASLRGREFTNGAEFAEAVRGAAGGGADAHMDRILRNALVVTLADAAPAPEGAVSIAERDREQRGVPAGSPDFGIVYFDFDKSNIKPEFDTVIRGNAQHLLDNAEMKVAIEGHADERGTNEYNLALGQRRAEAVRQALISAGVSAGQLSTVSYGEERPVAFGSDEESWSKNRRSVMVVN